MAKKFPINPKHPERLCWGCDRYCPADSLACGNGCCRAQHPIELFGENWFEISPKSAIEPSVANIQNPNASLIIHPVSSALVRKLKVKLKTNK